LAQGRNPSPGEE
jgi:hypothetical protein